MRSSSTVAFSALMAVANGMAMSPNPILPRALSGDATFYGGNLNGGACSFTTISALPAGVFGTALSDSNWANSAECGACISVTGPAGTVITAMIVDECPGCGTNHLDLFPDAFSTLANPSIGVIDVTWSYVDCPITTPLQLHNKDGVSAYWFSMQVVNANQAVSTLEVSSDGGSTWLPTTRQTYNFFEISSGAGSTVDVKVTSVNGEVVIVKDISVTGDSSVTASSNFGASSSAVTAPVVASSSAAEVVVVASSTPVTIAPVESSTTPIVVAPAPTTTEAATPSISGAAFVPATSYSLDVVSYATTALPSSKTTVAVSQVSDGQVQATSAVSAISPVLTASASASASAIVSAPSVQSASAAPSAITVFVTSCSSSEIPPASTAASSTLSAFFPSSVVVPSGVASPTGFSKYSATATATSSPQFTGAASTVSGSMFIAGAAALAAVIFA